MTPEQQIDSLRKTISAMTRIKNNELDRVEARLAEALRENIRLQARVEEVRKDTARRCAEIVRHHIEAAEQHGDMSEAGWLSHCAVEILTEFVDGIPSLVPREATES